MGRRDLVGLGPKGPLEVSPHWIVDGECVGVDARTLHRLIQPMYSLIRRQAEVELVPMALAEDIAVAPYSPLGSGLFRGKYQPGGKGRLSTAKRYAAREWGTQPATLAVAWAAKHPVVSAPILSGRNAQQLEPSLKALGVCLTAEQQSQIEALSPRPAPATDRLEEAVA